MTTSLKQINTNIKLITNNGGKLDTLATTTATLIIEHGNKTNHYDRAAALVNALSFNQRLQKAVLIAFVGTIPHTLRAVNGEYRLGKQDKSLLRTPVEIELVAEERAIKQSETNKKTAAAREEKSKKLAQYDIILAKNQELIAENISLKAQLAAVTAKPKAVKKAA